MAKDAPNTVADKGEPPWTFGENWRVRWNSDNRNTPVMNRPRTITTGPVIQLSSWR